MVMATTKRLENKVLYDIFINKNFYLSLLLLYIRPSLLPLIQMGANNSRSEVPDEKVLQNEIPISV